MNKSYRDLMKQVMEQATIITIKSELKILKKLKSKIKQKINNNQNQNWKTRTTSQSLN